MAKKKNKARAEPKQKREAGGVVSWLCSPEAYDTLACSGYTRLSKNPEVVTAVNTIARLIGSMTIYLMQNTEDGDVRIKNELSRKIDVNPNGHMVRSNFVQWIVKTMYLDGEGNAVVWPKLTNGYLEDLRPVPPGTVSLIDRGIWDYDVAINGAEYSPDEILHFTMNPNGSRPWRGEGFRVPLAVVANDLKQAAETKKGFMESKWKPSIIVKVDTMIDELSTREGRRRILDDYIDTERAGEPWVIPTDQIAVDQIKPLSLSDLALSDMVTLDKRTVAAILGVPAFVLGIGEFSREAWNNFINVTIMPIAEAIQQELTKKLLYSPELYFKFNPRSLFNYDLKDIAEIASNQYVRGLMTGNEARDWIGLPPKEGLDKLIVLENLIPIEKIGDQKKLIQDGGEE